MIRPLTCNSCEHYRVWVPPQHTKPTHRGSVKLHTACALGHSVLPLQELAKCRWGVYLPGSDEHDQ